MNQHSSQPLNFLRRALAAREASVLLVLVIISCGIGLSSVRAIFFSQENLSNISKNIAMLSVFAIGETIVIISGGIDLSLGSLIAFTGMILAAIATNKSMKPEQAFLVGLVIAPIVASMIGCVYAQLIQRLRLPPFVVTLAAMTILSSQALRINNQSPIPLSDFPMLKFLSDGYLPHTGIPCAVALVLVLGLIVHFILTRTSIGRYIYSLGSNEQATRLSGVNVGRVKMFAYGASGLLGGIAGILYAGYTNQGDPLSGKGYELNAVAAAVIGGASLSGGQGSVLGTILGATLLQMIITFVNLKVQNSAVWEGTIYGTVLLSAVLVTAYQQRKNNNT